MIFNVNGIPIGITEIVQILFCIYLLGLGLYFNYKINRPDPFLEKLKKEAK
ncbi:MAG TPA: hypothetical protein P5556_02025 [Candidatus Gastranaerophilales bacterium]|nr:hypothetical protein [Candidatus Gastranaerophilales bacterium]